MHVQLMPCVKQIKKSSIGANFNLTQGISKKGSKLTSVKSSYIGIKIRRFTDSCMVAKEVASQIVTQAEK